MITAPHLRRTLLILVLIVSISTAQTTRQTLYSLQGYSDLQPCAQSCIMDPGSCRVGGVDQIAINIGCQYNWCLSDLGAAETCYCRPDLQTVAAKYLTHCLKAACTLGDPSIELSSAVNLYQNYCTSKGFLATPAGVDASTTAAGGATATKTVASSPPSSSSSLTSPSISGEPSSPTNAIAAPTSTTTNANNGLNRGDKIALGCGLGVPLAALIIGYLSYRETRKTRRAQEQR